MSIKKKVNAAIEYFLKNQDRSSRSLERKAKLQIMILLLGVVLIPLVSPIIILGGNIVDGIATLLAYTFFCIGLYSIRKGVSYFKISAAFIVVLTLANFSGHLLYATRPLFPILWYLFILQFTFFQLGKKWALSLLGTCLIYSFFVVYLEQNNLIPSFYIEQFKNTNINVSVIGTVIPIVLSSVLLEMYAMNSYALTEKDLKQTIDSLQETNLELQEAIEGKDLMNANAV